MKGTKTKELIIEIWDYNTGETAKTIEGTNKERFDTIVRILKNWMKANKDLGIDEPSFNVVSNSSKVKATLNAFIEKKWRVSQLNSNHLEEVNQ